MWAMKENGHALTKTELDKLFRFFDRNGDDKVSYHEFISAIRGEMNEHREGLVRGLFAKLDKEG